MPCNRAISITKAAVSNEQLAKLLTPEIVEQLVRAYLAQQDYNTEDPYAVSVTRRLGLNRLQFRLGGYYGIDLVVQNGQVTVNTTSADQRAEALKLLDGMQALLAGAADKLFAAKVGAALGKLGGKLTSKSVAVEDQGVQRQATVFSVKISR